MIPLSANGTLRTLLILLIIWLVLRMVMRMRQPPRAPGTHRAGPDRRAPGEVRIERPDGDKRTPRGDHTIDVDHEEIR